MDFYRGDVAGAIAADMRDNDGYVSSEDLAGFAEPEPRAAVRVGFGDGDLYTTGPPAGGLALAQLAAMATSEDRWIDPDDPGDLLLLIEMIRRVRRDRQRYRLEIGARDLDGAARYLDPATTTAAMSDARAAAGPGETSHLCVMDRDGATVSMTVSIERSFGAASMSPRLGFLYNGYLRAFKIKNRRHPHYLRAGVPARSNAAPTIVVGPGRRVVAIGSTGSERMISGIFATLLRLRRQSPFDAVAAPRVHCTPDGEVIAEVDRLPTACRAAVEARYPVKALEPYAFPFGGLQLSIRDGGEMTGVGEPRRDGYAATPELV